MVKELNTGAEFQQELSAANSKLVVVDFFAVWCGPCQRIAPAFQSLETKYPNAIFLKIDVDKCGDTAAENGVSAMPTFIFFRNKNKVDQLRGTNMVDLEEKIKKWVGSGEDEEEEGMVKGHMDLSTMFMKSGCECLNESDDHPLEHALTPAGGFLESDCDEQLIIAISFQQPVKLHSLKMWGPPDKGPKNIKIFINQPHTMDFDSAESMEPTQAFELTTEDLQQGALIQMRYVKYQNIQNVTVFIKDNQSGGETTQVDYFGFVGSPLSATNMSEFKRVAGKKGESH